MDTLSTDRDPGLHRRRRRSLGFWVLTVLSVGGYGGGVARGQGSPAAAAWTLRTPGGRAAVVKRWREEAESRRAEAWQRAAAAGWSAKGPGYELQAIRNHRVYVYHTMNVNAALSTGAAAIRNTPPWSVNGSGRTAGVWDAGSVRSTHREFGGRVAVKDGAAADGHSTHVGGTIGAAGVDAAALGMAPGAAIDSYDWNSDSAEMAARAMATPGEPNTLQLSNHSYGVSRGWSGSYWYGVWPAREDEGFGQYDENAQVWDSLCYHAPYYLPCKAAGNDRSDAAPAAGTTFYYYGNDDAWHAKAYDPASDPYADGYDQGGFDTILGDSTGKNILTVGAVNDAVVNGVRTPGAASMSWFSGWGPADDGRIKPDVVGNGVGLYSTYADSDASYTSMSGTSMATPNVCGSALLLTEWYGRLFPGQYLRASALKGLLIHTADDLGNAGPDYTYGWGLVNVRAAADLLQQQHDLPAALHLQDLVLDAATTNVSIAFRWDGLHAIRATLCWTDPPGPIRSGLDNRAPVLVNDLDLRLIDPAGQVHLPYVLQPTSPAAVATTGTNRVDNVEQVYLATPGSTGLYTLVVSVHGVLEGGSQVGSLILSGSTGSPPSIVSGSPLPAGQAGVAYGQALSAVGGTPPYVWSLVAGSLPSGLSVGSTGVISGTPVLSGTSHGRLRVTDQQGASAEAPFLFPIGTQLLEEGFEHGGAMPAGWTQQYVTSATDWLFQPGGYSQAYPSAAREGSYNAYLFADARADHKTRLITPQMDLGAVAQPVELLFWHSMEVWGPDQDELRVYYKTTGGGAWVLLATYTNSVATWTQRTLPLPSPSSTYSLAFEGNARWGYGVCLDQVQVMSAPPAPTNTSYGTAYAWLAQAGLAGGGDYEVADAGDADGDGYLTWQEFVAGTDPTNPVSHLQVAISGSNETLRITWTPDLGAARVYHVEGCTNLTTGSWGSTNSGSRYFRVRVEQP